MNQFIKFAFASCLGVFLAMIALFGFLFLFGISAAMSGGGNVKSVEKNSILKIELENNLPELTDNVDSKNVFKLNDKTIGLQDFKALIQQAKEDNKIKGILLKSSFIESGHATASVMRDALLDFKKSGKFILAYGDYYSQGGYYLASTANKIYLNPSGVFDFRGFASVIGYYKELLDRIGVKPQVYYAGQFKSATEPFRANSMSPQNRIQVSEYLNGLYDVYVNDIAETRKISTDEIRKIADQMLVKHPNDALKYKLIDEVAHYDAVESEIRKRLKMSDKDKINLVDLNGYFTNFEKKNNYSAKDKIAVIYAEGTIGMGDEDTPGGINDYYAKIVRDIRRDDKVKAIVLRVNSPGGSSITSDNILRELQLAKKQGIKIVVSMGDYAASGGYYISCNADSIFAEPNTITGSIGVFAMVPSFDKTLDKIGINFDTVKTSKHAADFSTVYEFGKDEGNYFQEMVDSNYQTFISLVAAGRHKTKEQIHEIAQGRVWTGAKAKEIGLVDRLGGLDDALASAANLAKLKNYRTDTYPKMKEPIQRFLDEITGQKETKAAVIKKELGEFYPYYQQLKNIQNMSGVQMLLPIPTGIKW